MVNIYRLMAFVALLGAYFTIYAVDANAVANKAVVRESRPAVMTIIRGCDNGYSRSRSVRNWQNKCKKKQQARLRSTRSRKSRILTKPVLRISRKATPTLVAPSIVRPSHIPPLRTRRVKLSEAVKPKYTRPVRRQGGHYNPYYRPGQ